MSTDVFTGSDAVTTQDTDQKARAAVRAFRLLQPTLTSYARILTGKPNVRVEISPTSNGMTDGKKIYFRPPIALGDNTPHQRRLCDKRNDSYQQLCPACQIREDVLIVIYHEIGHIAHDSFAKTTDYDRAHLVANALDQVDKKFAIAVKQRIERTPSYVTDSYMGIAGLVSPFLPGIVNALDDARVNARTMEARPGTKAMFKAFVFRVFDKGVEQRDRDGQVIVKHWREYPLNMQAVAGILCTVSGYEIGEWLVPEVVAAMQDEQIQDILRKFPTVRNVSGVYAMSIPLLVRLRQLGFFKSETDPVTEEEEEENADVSDDPDEPEDSEQESGGDSGPDGEASDSSDPEQGDEGEGSTDSEGEPGESGAGGSDEDGADAGSDPQAGEDSDVSDSGDSDGVPDSSVSADGEDESSDSDQSDGKGDGGEQPSDNSSDPDGNAEAGSEGDLSDDTGESSGASSDQPVESEETSDETDGSGVRDDRLPEGVEDSDDTGTGAGTDNSPDEDTEVSDLDDSGDVDSHGEGDRGSSESGDSSDQQLAEPSEGVSDPGSPTEEAPEEDDSSPSDEMAGDVQDESPDGRRDSVDDEPIDSGEDEGLGGIEVKENSAFDELPMGTPEEVERAIHELAHPEDRPEYVEEGKDSEEEIERAVLQGMYFETPSRRVFGVREHYWDQPVVIDGYNMSQGWNQEGRFAIGYSPEQLGIEGDFDCSESILGPALLRMRVAFADNRRGKDMRNRKSGKVDSRVLGKRAHHGDERVFRQRIIPGKKDYFVLIGIDISGSTIGKNIALAKKAAMGQATLCHRMGIKFAVFAHSGKMHNPRAGRAKGVDVDIYHLKDPDEPWTAEVQKRLLEIGPDSANLDGHTFEYYRKILDKRSETHKVMLYYTDGKMPAENAEEELVILQREIKTCRHKRYVLLGVGIRTDSPIRHGLDTVRVDGEEDIVKVVKHLEKRLLEI